MWNCMSILGSKQVVTKAVSRNDSNIVNYLQCIEGIVAIEYGLKIWGSITVKRCMLSNRVGNK